MAEIHYRLTSADMARELYPPARYVNRSVGLETLEDVIAHYTASSLLADGFTDPLVEAALDSDTCMLSITCGGDEAALGRFAQVHARIFGPEVCGKAIAGKQLLEQLGVWNPMAGFPVNSNPDDADCKWHLFPPLGLNVVGQRGILLMHYPPWQVLQQATFSEVMTMQRWHTVLRASGLPVHEVNRYGTFIDVNPIAAPGEGQSEYPNDYFPIMMASGVFDGPAERDFIRSALETWLNGPEARGKRYTLPLLICGSPLYDPQAPGWFKVAYKDVLPVDANGTPETPVLQAGSFRVRPDSPRETPYMIANHMIAAGVTGRCTDDARKIPDIRKYEAQDLVAASFLRAYADEPDADPTEVAKAVCRRWFGADNGDGAPHPPAAADRRAICALSQMDLFYCPGPPPQPKYKWDQAVAHCAGAGDNPCGPEIGPCRDDG